LTQGGVGSLKDECGERNGKKNSNKTVALQIIFAFLKIFVLNQLLVGMVERDFL